MTLFFHVSAATANYDSSLCNIKLNNNLRISKQYKIMKFEFQAPKNTVFKNVRLFISLSVTTVFDFHYRFGTYSCQFLK